MPSDFFGLGGHVIDGQFHAIEVAGEGGFSVVYRGQHLSMREPIAIKCLKLQVDSSDATVVSSFTQRFFDESRIMYRLSQGNLDIARSVTSGVTVAPARGSTVPYMVLEWLEGDSLAKDLKRRRAQNLQGRPLAEVMTMFEPAALAIGYAHSQGVVHRDVKPGNLFLHARREGVRMKVLDFGMAKVLSPEAMGGLESTATLGNMAVVSPQYAAPEQLEARAGTIGPWTDVYAFALVLVEALTDRRARDAATLADLMVQLAKRGPAPTPRARGAGVSDAVESVLACALAYRTSDRYPDMNALWAELRRAAAEPPRVSQAVTRPNPAAPNFAQTVGMPESLPTAVREYLAQKPAEGQAPQGQAPLGRTLPLAQPQAPAPAGRPFSGTLPLQASAGPVPQQPPQIAPAAPPAVAPSAPPVTPPPQVAPPPPVAAPLPVPAPMRAAPRTSRALVFLLLLFVLVAMGTSAMLFYRALVLHR
ncbi:MAG TPA: protein kinase [Polyangiaceae bacterium]|nr:protein kinase [Polyangiaceae bacterium]